jgi:hypothetical protein
VEVGVREMGMRGRGIRLMRGEGSGGMQVV